MLFLIILIVINAFTKYLYRADNRQFLQSRNNFLETHKLDDDHHHHNHKRYGTHDPISPVRPRFESSIFLNYVFRRYLM